MFRALGLLSFALAHGPALAALIGLGAALAPSSRLPAACHARGDLPDPACTPGAVATRSLDVVCGTATRERRHVNRATRRRVLAAYGVKMHPAPGAYEIDHLIPLELGGSNDVANLWPESAPGYHDKDRVEDRLHALVCSGAMRLEDAQRAIAANWRRALPEASARDARR